MEIVYVLSIRAEWITWIYPNLLPLIQALLADLVDAGKHLMAGRSINTAIKAGSALAFTSAVVDVGGQTTRIDNGKEYYPYTTKKRSTVE